MSWFMVDVESDGPAPGVHSMIEFGVVKVQPDLISAPTFHGKLRPVSDVFVPEALAVSGNSREQVLQFPDPKLVMQEFADWIEENSKGLPIFVSDNNGFDFAFINHYFWRFLGKNPFGHSSRNLGDLYKGLVQDTRKNFKHLRITRHTPNPIDDAMGNAEALLCMHGMGLNINLN